MSGQPLSPVGPILILLVVLASDVWVYADAQTRSVHRRPVVAELGPLRVETPMAWFAGCVVLWIFFLPLYLRARRE